MIMFSLDVLRNLKLKICCRNSTMDQQVDIMLEMLLHIKSFAQAITGPHYSKTRIAM